MSRKSERSPDSFYILGGPEDPIDLLVSSERNVHLCTARRLGPIQGEPHSPEDAGLTTDGHQREVFDAPAESMTDDARNLVASLAVDRLCFNESIDNIEASYRSARAGRLPDNPMIEALIQSTLDDSLAEPGHHVMSLLGKYFPFDLADDANWDDMADKAADGIIAYLRRYIRNLDDIIVGRQVLTPLDFERRFGMTRGDICHGRLEPDQLFSMRPHPDAAQYATPVKALYQCGSGAHPGGGVTGAPGFNAARRVIKDWAALRKS